MHTTRIFFDQNPFIQTNTTLTKYGTPTVSAKNPVFLDQLKLSPNPANESISVNFADLQFENLKIELTDISARRVTLINITNALVGKPQIEVDISDLNPGLYLMKIESEKGSATKKFVKL